MELKRLFWTRRMLLLIGVLLFVNSIGFLQEQTGQKEIGFLLDAKTASAELYRLLQDAEEETGNFLPKLKELKTDQEKMDADLDVYGSETEGYGEEALRRVIAQAEYVAGFPDKLEDIDRQASQMNQISIFQSGDSLSRENITKTQKDYQNLNQVEVSLGHGSAEAVTAVIDYRLVHVLLGIYAVILVILLLEERQNPLFYLEFSAYRGRRSLAVRRYGVLMAGVFLMAVLLYGSLLLISFSLYGGWEDIVIAAQSVPRLQDFTVCMPLGVFLVIYLLTAAVCSFLLGLLLWGLYLWIENRNLAFFLLGVVMAAEYLLYAFLPPQNIWGIGKYANLVAVLFPSSLFTEYRNLSFAGLLIEKRLFFEGFVVLMIMIGSFWIIWRSGQKRSRERFLNRKFFVTKLKQKMQRIRHGFLKKTGIPGFELYKIWGVQKGIWIILLLLVYLVMGMNREPMLYGKDLRKWNDFCTVYEGVAGEAVENFIKGLESTLDTVDKEYEEAKRRYSQGQLNIEGWNDAQFYYLVHDSDRTLLSLIQERVSYLEELEEDTGIQGWILKEGGFEHLWGKSAWRTERNNGMMLLGLLILLIPGVFSCEWQTDTRKKLFPLNRGRRWLFRKKMLGIGITTCLMAAIVYGIRWYDIYWTYGLSAWRAPVQSLTFMWDFPLPLTIGSFTILLYLLRLTLLFCASAALAFLSNLLSVEKCLLISAVIFLIPSLLYEVGFSWAEKISYVLPLGGLELWSNHGSFFYLAVVAFLYILGGGSLYGTKFLWCQWKGEQK